jgi:hypothetical protein
VIRDCCDDAGIDQMRPGFGQVIARRRNVADVLDQGAVAICVGIDFGAISSMTRLPDHAARSIV